jgi:hypothetical protein
MNCQIIVITTIVPPHRIPGEIDPSTRCDTVWTPPAKRLDGQGQKRAPAGPNKMLITDEHIHIHTIHFHGLMIHVMCVGKKVVVVQVATVRRMEYFLSSSSVCQPLTSIDSGVRIKGAPPPARPSSSSSSVPQIIQIRPPAADSRY